MQQKIPLIVYVSANGVFDNTVIVAKTRAQAARMVNKSKENFDALYYPQSTFLGTVDQVGVFSMTKLRG